MRGPLTVPGELPACSSGLSAAWPGCSPLIPGSPFPQRAAGWFMRASAFLAWLAVPSPSSRPPGERARPCRSRWSTLRLTDLDRRGLVCSARPGTTAAGRTDFHLARYGGRGRGFRPLPEPECPRRRHRFFLPRVHFRPEVFLMRGARGAALWLGVARQDACSQPNRYGLTHRWVQKVNMSGAV